MTQDAKLSSAYGLPQTSSMLQVGGDFVTDTANGRMSDYILHDHGLKAKATLSLPGAAADLASYPSDHFAVAVDFEIEGVHEVVRGKKSKEMIDDHLRSKAQ